MPHIPEDNAYYPERTSLFELSDSHPHGDVDVLFIGASLMQRALWNEFLPGLNVLNRGIGSDSTQGVLKRLWKYKGYKARNIVLQIGLNDFAYHFTMDESMENYRSILASLRDDFSGSTTLVISLLPNLDHAHEEGCLVFNERLEKLCSSFGITYIDAWSRFKERMADNEAARELFAPDRLHLTGKGYEILIDCFVEHLKA